ncbi:sensor histidine kinase [Amycolatopsis nigrescens]|uniref:sensor histidine kinase n=1 Tax=Amycolatopsis nigrescens TaxID=381445 RepID=UPI0003600B77|nr:sensor histidine kinase [Amycolatopsis nigrescens]
MRRVPTLFLVLTIGFLAVAGWSIVSRAAAPSDGTAVNAGDTAVAADQVIIRDAVPGGPLREGDRLIAVNGVVPAQGRLAEPVRAGDVLHYEIVRDEQRQTVEVTLRTYDLAGNLGRAWPSLLVNFALLGTALVIFLIRPRDPAAHAGILASGIGVATIAASGCFQLEALDLFAGGQFLRWYGGEFCFALLWGGMLHFALAFPEVTDRQRHRRWVIAGYLGAVGLYAVIAGYASLVVDEPLARLALLGSPAIGSLYVYPFLVSGVLIGKYVRYRDVMLRRRLRWLAGSLGGGAALYLAVWILPTALAGEPPIPLEYQTLAFLPVPFAVTVAILRHRALNIEVVLGRSLVYGTLTVLLAGVYIGVVSLLSLLFPPLDQLWQQAVAAAVLALAVQPLRARLQAVVNTKLYGERNDPYRVVSTLAQRLENIHTPEEQLPAVVETIGVALRLPYVAIELDRNSGTERAASYGTPTPLCHRLPLSYQGELVGQLVIARRGPREVLRRKERSMLAEVARHAGTVVHTARLTTDLLRSRDRLVTAREEERRRLVRELHDGVGTTLAAITLGLHATQRTLGEAVPASVLLARLQVALGEAITEIRRLTHGLRPPVLEKLGLLAAIEDYVGTLNQAVDPAGCEFTLDAPAELPALPPAVDVAAYRIVCEALTNVTKHAEARTCTVELRTGDGLRITITDDGIGLPSRPCPGPGIGLGSMRERATELGGEFRAERLAGGGTMVSASLPMPEDAP